MTIKECRENTGLSQSKFARIYGIPVKTLQQWEQGVAKPTDYFLTIFEKALRYDGYLGK